MLETLFNSTHFKAGPSAFLRTRRCASLNALFRSKYGLTRLRRCSVLLGGKKAWQGHIPLLLPPCHLLRK